ncbi:MAG: YafY family transcriptional regulator [Lachnospiraceae bacterium]|nr:YafY family transcriptional regulator [Lachnospiraceae bacterium]
MQINRLFEIVYILLEKRKVTAQELAKHFEVSPRTIYRDIEILSGAGIPVYMSKGKGGGVSLLSEFVLNKAVITEREREEILSALKAVDAVRLGEEDSALQKLGSLFGESQSDWIEVDFGFWADGKREERLFQDIKEAIIGKKVIRFSYANVKGQETEREVEPLKLCFKGESWYLYGYCRKREDCRFFKLKRIRKLQLTEETFMRSCGGQVLRRQQENYRQETIKLKLKIAREAAYRVYDEFENYEQMEDGSFLVEIRFPKGAWMFYYLISFGRHLEVLEPEEVRKQLKDELNKILDIYS